MAQSEKPPTTHSSSSRQAPKPRAWQAIAYLWSEWRVEILVLVVVALAVFLLVERMQIRQTLLAWLQQGLAGVRNLGLGAREALSALIQRTTLSDLTGYVLLLFAIVVVLWRVRWRLTRSARLSTQRCPRCGSELSRIRRRPIDRVVNLYLPVARYRCRDGECAWHGQRVRSGRRQGSGE